VELGGANTFGRLLWHVLLVLHMAGTVHHEKEIQFLTSNC